MKFNSNRSFLLFFALSFYSIWPFNFVAAKELNVSLFQHNVTIDTSFSGTEIGLFGSVRSEGDIIVILRGPKEDITIWEKERKWGMWVNHHPYYLSDVYQYYYITSNRNTDTCCSDFIKKNNQTSLDHLTLSVQNPDISNEKKNELRTFLKRHFGQKNFYKQVNYDVVFHDNTLFSCNIPIPSNIKSGLYDVVVYYLKDGEILDAESLPLQIRKSGIEAFIYYSAHQSPLLYAVLSIIISLIIGIVAGFISRKFGR